MSVRLCIIDKRIFISLGFRTLPEFMNGAEWPYRTKSYTQANGRANTILLKNHNITAILEWTDTKLVRSAVGNLSSTVYISIPFCSIPIRPLLKIFKIGWQHTRNQHLLF